MRRRQFIGAGAILTAGFAFPQTKRIESRPARRKSIICLPPDAPDLARYRKAVDIMRNQLQPTDPESWASMAMAHEERAPHFNWWFLPWHRAFIYYFEEICRSVLRKYVPHYRDDPPFRLPYWDWTRFPYIPEPFLDPGSPLWYPGRTSAGQVQIGCEVVGAPLLDSFLQEPAIFNVFGQKAATLFKGPGPGLLEGIPHSTVHIKIGGAMPLPTSPLDPLFWVHHCNVDRVWESWLTLHNHAVPAEPEWGNQTLDTVQDPASNQTIPRCADTVGAGLFGAQYDRLETLFGCSEFENLPSAQIFLGPEGEINAPGPPPVILTARKVDEQRVSFSSEISKDLVSLLEKNPHLRPLRSRPVFPYFVLLLDQTLIPRIPTTALRVFLNSPGASASTPFDELGYLGTVSVFPAFDPTMEHRKTSFAFNIGPALARLKASGRLANTLDISLVSVDLADSKITPEQVIPEKVRIAGLKGNVS